MSSEKLTTEEAVARVFDPAAFDDLPGYSPEAAAQSRYSALDSAEAVLAVARPLIRDEVIAEVVAHLEAYGPLDSEWAKFFALVIKDLGEALDGE